MTRELKTADRPAPDRTAPGQPADGETLIGLMMRNAQEEPRRVAMREKKRGVWEELSWGEMADEVLLAAAGLEDLGIRPGDAVMVLGDNRTRLYLGMLAVVALRGQPMPTYPGMTLGELTHFAGNARVVAALAEDQEQVDKLLELRAAGVEIRTIVYDKPRGLRAYRTEGLVAWSDLLELGRKRFVSDLTDREELIRRAQPGDPAIFLHSSGTTGKPKSIVLTHGNVIACAHNARAGKLFGADEELVAYLPMAWAGDFILTVVSSITYRFTVNVPERQETLLNDMREIAPTLYLAAPRSWDNLLTMIHVRMQSSTPAKRFVFSFFLNRAMEAERRKLQGRAPGIVDRFWRVCGELTVFGAIRDHFGLNRIRNAFTGGEAIGEDTFVFYRAIGVRLRQVYGQTEISAFATAQAPDEIKLHTVGRPLPGVEIDIGGDGEILVRSKSVFADNGGADTWLHTGDAGYFEGGELVLLGRLSEVVHTADGERFVPNYIENRLKFSPYIKDAAVIGAGREELVAMICTDFEPLAHWAEQRGIPYMSYADLSQRPEVADVLRRDVERVNRIIPEKLRIRRFVSLPKEFDPDDGEITRTRKLRRSVIEERYAPVIEAFFDGSSEVTFEAAFQYESGEVGKIERTLSVRSV